MALSLQRIYMASLSHNAVRCSRTDRNTLQSFHIFRRSDNHRDNMLFHINIHRSLLGTSIFQYQHICLHSDTPVYTK
ncbi:hypothetical protein X975_19572, partial [Stegodyphus mimosarum]